MLFKDFVLLVRQRIQDMRKSDGTLVTTATEDGIRWSSAVLAQICKGQMMSVLRTFSALKLRSWINEAVQYQVVQGTIAAGTGIISLTGDPSFSRIMNIQELSNPDKIYDFLPQEDYFDQRYKTTGIVGAYYTYFYDTVDKIIKAYCLPLSNTAISIQVIAKIPLDSIYDISSDIEMPFIDIDDLLIDYAEKECRQIEGNEVRAKDLEASIDFKIKELANELSGS